MTESEEYTFATHLMDYLHFDSQRNRAWWSFAIYWAQKGQVACVLYGCEPGWSILDTNRDTLSKGFGSTIPDAIFNALANYLKHGKKF